MSIIAHAQDTDADGVLDSTDNCVSTFNPFQRDTDGDGIGDVCDTDDDGDGILDTAEGYTTNFDNFDTISANTTITSGSTSGIAGLNGILSAYWNYNSSTAAASYLASFKSETSYVATPSIVLDQDASAISGSLQNHMANFVAQNEDLTAVGRRLTLSADFYVNNGSAKTNEYGIFIGAPNQDPLWSEDISGEVDGILLYGFGTGLFRSPDSNFTFSGYANETGWFRQEATFYLAPNGSNISTLYADTRVGKYTTGLTGIVTDTRVDLGVQSRYSWLSNSAAGFSVDAFLDNIRIQVSRDTDGDGIPDHLDTDSDNDGLEDQDEITIGSNPLIFEDNDGDGIADHFDPDDDNDGILDSVECGYPNGGVQNGSFESNVATYTYQSIQASNVDGWGTTDAGNVIEIWGNGHNGRYAFRGMNFAEINATSNGALYQELVTVPGNYVIWSVAHQGRNSNTETLRVEAGTSLSSSTLLHQEDAINGQWKFYSGVYLVPAAQTSTTFFFNTPDMGSFGNLIDAVSFDRPSSDCSLDTDGDGIKNSLDLDTDDDGILDATEGGTNDTDGDGILNFMDNDDDGDGILSSVETNADADSDGIPNYLDADADGDGINDATETATDTDGDGTPNYLDLDADGDSINDATETATDTDGDGSPNYLDLDADDDGFNDSIELLGDEDSDGFVNYIDPKDAGYSVSPSGLITVNESGTVTASLDVVLDRKPASNVTLLINNSNAAEVGLTTTTLVFTAANWNTTQTIIITGVDESVRDGDKLISLTFSVDDPNSDNLFDPLADQVRQVRNQDDDPESCDTRNFSVSDFIDNNDSSYISGGEYRITSDNGARSGSIWYQRKLDLRVEFTIDVEVYLGDKNGLGADGLAFVLQNLDTGQGSTGGGLGYGGSSPIDPSYAIEIDTYENGPDPDSGNDHIGFVEDGDTGANQEGSADVVEIIDVENDEWHDFRIQWSPTTTTLSYIFTHFDGTVYQDSKVINLVSVIGANIAYWGFTASTGGKKNRHSVRFDNSSICMADEILRPTAMNEVSGVSTQTICAASTPTLNDLAISVSRPDGVNPRTDVSSNPFNLVWFDAATGGNFLIGTTVLVDGATYYAEAANLSDPSALTYRQSENRLEVVIDLVYGGFTSTNTLAVLNEGSDTSTFSIVLDDEPTGNVVYDLTTTDATQMSVFPASMTFTPANWNVTQTGTITTVNESVVDGDHFETFRIELDAGLSDDCYSITPVNYVIQILDNETAGFSLSPVSGSLAEGNIQTASVSVVLTAAPLTNVIVDVQSLDTTEVTLGVTSLTFTPSNWNTAQTVTLTSVDELLVDGTQVVSITASINSASDAAFTSLATQTVSLSHLDNDTPGFTLSALTGTLTEASTQTASFTMVLDAQPASDVIINLSLSPTDEVSSTHVSLTFTNANWNATQTIMLSSRDDFIIDGTINSTLTFSIDPSSDALFSSVGTQTIIVPNLDNEIPDFTLSPLQGGDLAEGDSTTVSFTVILDAEPNPGEFVILDILSSDTTESQVVTTTAVLVFTAADWNIPQTVSLISVDDVTLDGTITSSITVSISPFSISPAFSVVNSQTLTVNTLDNDLPGFSLTPITGSLMEASTATASFTVVLAAQPLTDVTLDFTSSDIGEVNVISPPNKTFTYSNWNIPQTISLQSADEYFIDGSQSVSITAAINPTSNPGFLGVASQTIVVANADNDIASITLIPADNLSSETGDTASFYLRLTAIPSADVQIDLRSLNPSEALPTQNQLTFTPANWNVPQLITIYGVNDSPPLADGTQTVTIVTENVSSTDSDFGAITNSNMPNFVVMNQDDDAPGVLITLLENNFQTSESGSTVTLMFELTTQPAAGATVQIPLSLGAAVDEMTLSASSVLIQNADWNQPSLNQITLTGIDDNLIDGTQMVKLITGSPLSTDSVYANISAASVADVVLYNLDNDDAGLMLTQPQVVSENGSTTTFTVALQTSILATTTILLTVEDPTEVQIDQQRLVFEPNNWKFPQSIVISGLDDNLIDGDILSSIRLSIDTSNCDSFYCILDTSSVLVLNLDNDSDSDNDGIFDALDNCPFVFNPNQEDFDQDGIGDICDNDRDGDGVENQQEIQDTTNPDDPCSYLFQSITLARLDLGDCDNDQIPNPQDLDDDNDGILDSDEGFNDTDLDGIPDHLDLDADNDGCFDVLEAGFTDEDLDGVLGQNPVTVDWQGRVVGFSGYEVPADRDQNARYDFQENTSALDWVTQPISAILFTSDIQLSAEVSSPTYALYQWQINSSTAGLASWEELQDSEIVEGAQTNRLRLVNATADYGGREIRLLIYSSVNTCQAPLISEVVTIGPAEIIIPNAFSPDGDGINDQWEIQGLNEGKAYQLSVYNRWETKVFETTNYENDWTGTSNVQSFIGADNKLPDGTYFYILTWMDGSPPLTGFLYIQRRN